MPEGNKVIKAFGFGWRRTGDASVIAWLFPTVWVKLMGGLVAIISGLAAGFKHAPLWQVPLYALVGGILVIAILGAARALHALISGAEGNVEDRPAQINTGSITVGRDNTGSIQNFHNSPVTINHGGYRHDSTVQARGVSARAEASRVEPASSVSLPNRGRSADAVRDTKLKSAIRYAISGRWDGAALSLDAVADIKVALEKLSQLAKTGELHIWAKNYMSPSYDEVPPSHWRKADIDFDTLFQDESHFDDSGLVTPPYRDVMVSKAEIETNWRISFQDAVQTAYETAEKDGWLDDFVSDKVSASTRLELFGTAFLVEARDGAILLYGIKRPSRQPMPISAEAVTRTHWVSGSSSLNSLTPNQVVFENVAMSRVDLDKAIAKLRQIING